MNTVNECYETFPLSITKNVRQNDFRFSTFLSYEKNVTLKFSCYLLLSEIVNNAIIARCFHPQILDLVFGCNVHLPRGVQAYVKMKVTSQSGLGKFAIINFCVDILSMLHLLWQLPALLPIRNETRCIPKGRRWLREARL